MLPLDKTESIYDLLLFPTCNRCGGEVRISRPGQALGQRMLENTNDLPNKFYCKNDKTKIYT